jgi:hypothetical protein
MGLAFQYCENEPLSTIVKKKILQLPLLFDFYPCYLNGCNGEVVQRALHLCYVCGDFPHVAGNAGGANTEGLATRPDTRMLIYCWPACTYDISDRALTILGLGHTELSLSLSLSLSLLTSKYKHPYCLFNNIVRLRLYNTLHT